MNATMTIVEAVLVHGNMDAKTAFLVQRCDKAVCKLVEMYKNTLLGEDESIPGVWVSNVLNMSISPSNVQEVNDHLRLMNGESEPMMKEVMRSNEVFQDLALQDKFVGILLACWERK